MQRNKMKNSSPWFFNAQHRAIGRSENLEGWGGASSNWVPGHNMPSG